MERYYSSRLMGKKYLITGATGYIGSMLVKYIRENDSQAQITVPVRNRQKAEALFGNDAGILVVELTDWSAWKDTDLDFDYLIHCASVTQSAEMLSHPVEVIESIVNLTQNVLELAKRKKVQSVVYVSSMEIYGNIDCSDSHRADENEMGKIDLLQARSCYPLGKRMAENICYSYYKEYGVPVKIARLAQTFGRGVPQTDNRVFVQFARAAKQKQNIALHTQGNSVGNYCGIDDALNGLIMILDRGVNGEAYNVVHEENTMTIRQMAELVCTDIANNEISVAYDIPEGTDIYGYAPDTGLMLSGKKLMELGWHPTQSLKQMYLDVISEMDAGA